MDESWEVSPAQTLEQLPQGLYLIDVREPNEWASGYPAQARCVRMADLPAQVGCLAPSPAHPIHLICASGKRSLYMAQQLRSMGYRNVYSVAGGFQRWRAEGHAWRTPGALGADAAERYQRHLQLPEVGEAGQLRLNDATALVLGVGGLGSPAALYLAAAGVGRIRLVDADRVERSNLQRQIVHSDARIGEHKVLSALQSLKALNPSIAVEACNEAAGAENIERLLQGVDVVVDGTDNFAARYILNDACVRLRKPWVYAAIHRFEAQVCVFGHIAPGNAERVGPCYRCLFPQPPEAGYAPNCAQAGVLGVLPGIAGTLQAAEALKILLGIGEPLAGRLLHIDVRTMRFRETRLPRDPQCVGCGTPALQARG